MAMTPTLTACGNGDYPPDATPTPTPTIGADVEEDATPMLLEPTYEVDEPPTPADNIFPENLNEAPAEDFEYRFDLDTQGVLITHYLGTSLHVIIPEFIEGEPVTRIGWRAFYESDVVYVRIPNTVRMIEGAAFNRSNLTSVIIPDSVETLGDPRYTLGSDPDIRWTGRGVFAHCIYLAEVTFGSSLTSISDNAFVNTGLSRVVIPDNVTTIGHFAFANNNNLTEVVFGNGLTNVGRGIFSGTSLTSVVIPSSMATVFPGLFSGIESLTEVTLNHGITKIGAGAFSGTGLTSIIIPDSITTIEGGAFRNTYLTDIVIPDSVTTVGDGAFAGTNLSIETQRRILEVWPQAFDPGLVVVPAP